MPLGEAGKGPLPKRPGRVLYRAAADRRNTSRATIRESSRQAYIFDRSSSTAQLRKTDSACGQQRTPRMSPALVPAMCPGSVPVLSTCLDRRPGRRQPAAAVFGRSFQKRKVRQDRSERTDCRIRPPDGREFSRQPGAIIARAGRTAIVVAHRLTTILNADRILMIDQGHFVKMDSRTDLLVRQGLFFDLYQAQSLESEQ